jgi:glycosidase
VKAEFPEALIVGEVWHYAGDFLQGDEWDSVMNYPFLNATMGFAMNEEYSATDYLDDLGFLRGNLNNACRGVMWNLLGSHDTPRALHCCGEDKRKMKLMAAMQLLQPGMPFIYYGDEVGLTGGRDPDCRRGMLWDENRQDRALLAYYKRLIAIRKSHPCLTEGDADEVRADDEKGIVIIRRGDLTLIFHGKEGTVSLPEYAGNEELISGEVFGGDIGPYQAAVIQF